ncbi:DUF3015 domain-containing protein [Isoalcanivorax indicus]|uniref:DUF3015 domain-containing protein n=1 Tax=Isoalcanivorax indicus TaxID=2202653 RepID=UPI000DBAB498|nr:DUF3015 domain-containing protein [Isoalcanivorax indicus]
MKKIVLATALLGASMTASANAPGGPGCGWGNMLFEGQSGLPIHLLATLVNGTSGNATFGMTSGTNGCDTSGALAYSGSSLLAMNGVLEEVAHDIAMGEGEALTALSVSMGVSAEDRGHFNQTLHQHFSAIFPHENVTAEDVLASIQSIMKADQQLAKYTA